MLVCLCVCVLVCLCACVLVCLCACVCVVCCVLWVALLLLVSLFRLLSHACLALCVATTAGDDSGTH